MPPGLAGSRVGLALVTALGLSGCLHRHPPAPALVGAPHYALGAPYQAGGHWFYPAEDLALDNTGIAAVLPDRSGLTADGELRDAAALTAAMQTLQLPAIVSVTNLDNGRRIRVRVNDRGPAAPGRIIALSSRAAILLAIPPQGAARVRVQLDQAMSRAVADQVGGGPRLQIATARPAEVTAQALPPPGQGPAGPVRALGDSQAEPVAARIPDRLPERIDAVPAEPGMLMIQAGSFGRAVYARVVAARLAGLGADVVRSHENRQTTYHVQAGPYASIAQADAALDEALRAGVVDARITVQ